MPNKKKPTEKKSTTKKPAPGNKKTPKEPPKTYIWN